MKPLLLLALLLCDFSGNFASAQERVQQRSQEGVIEHKVYIRGGREVDPKDAVYRPVVALIRTYEVYNEVTKMYEVKRSTCSGTVLNRMCVLTAEHCTAGPGQENLSIEIYDANKLEGATPVAVEHRTKVRGDKKMENDLALIRMDKALPEDQSVFTSNLHDAKKVMMLQDATVNIVGYGVFNSNWDPDTKMWTNVGAGTKRDGDMKVAKNIDGKDPLIELAPTIHNHSAAPGDSGGPLITSENGHTTVYGVTGSIDNKVLTNAHTNYYTSVAFHRDWIISSAQKLGCSEADAHKLTLDEFVHKNFNDYASADKDIKSLHSGTREETWERLQLHLWNNIDLSNDPNAESYSSLHIKSAKPDRRGNLVIRWEALFSENPGLDADIFRRLPNPKRAEGVMLIPAPPKLERDRLTLPVFRVPKQ